MQNTAPPRAEHNDHLEAPRTRKRLKLPAAQRVYIGLVILLACAVFGLQAWAWISFARWSLSSVGRLIQAEFKATALPLPPYKPSRSAQVETDLVKVCQNEPAKYDRLTIRFVTGNANFAALYFQVSGSRSEHYLQMFTGGKDSVETYGITLSRAGADADRAGVNCAWLKVEPVR